MFIFLFRGFLVLFSVLKNIMHMSSDSHHFRKKNAEIMAKKTDALRISFFILMSYYL